MKKWALAFLLIATQAFADTAPFFMGGNKSAQMIAPLDRISFPNQSVWIIKGALNPSIVAVSAPAGSIYLSTLGKFFFKTDAGLTTNWTSAAASGITALTGDVTAAGSGSVAAVVAFVGTSTAANVHLAELLANAATSTNTINTLLKRDGSGQVAATTFTGALAGNSTTATALAATPTGCSAGLFATSIAASGNLTCASATNASENVTNGGNASYTILASDEYVRAATVLTAQRAYTLYACTSLNIGKRVRIKNPKTQTFNIILTAAGTDLIEGASTFTLYPGDAASVICGFFSAVGNWELN